MFVCLVFCTSQAPEAHEVGTRELGAVQGGGATVAGGQPAGQTAAPRRRAVRSDILLPPRVRLPAETIAEEADALTKTLPPSPSRHRPPRRAPSPPPPRFFHTTCAATAFIYYDYYYTIIYTFVSIVFANFLNYWYTLLLLSNACDDWTILWHKYL